jgi:hypothetical protein
MAFILLLRILGIRVKRISQQFGRGRPEEMKGERLLITRKDDVRLSHSLSSVSSNRGTRDRTGSAREIARPIILLMPQE